MTKVTSSRFSSLQSVNHILLSTSLFIILQPTRFRKFKKRKATETRWFIRAKFLIKRIRSSSKRKKRYSYPCISKSKLNLWLLKRRTTQLKNKSGRNIVRRKVLLLMIIPMLNQCRLALLWYSNKKLSWKRLSQDLLAKRSPRKQQNRKMSIL